MGARRFVAGFVLGTLLVSTGAYAAFDWRLKRPRVFERCDQGRSIACQRIALPVPPGDVSLLRGFLDSCACPSPPDVEASSLLRAGVYSDRERSEAGLMLVSGVEIVYQGPGRAVSPSIISWRKFIDENPRWSLVPLRGTEAGVTEPSEAGPGVVSWVEAGYDIVLYGSFGQSAEELLDFARSMRAVP